MKRVLTFDEETTLTGARKTIQDAATAARSETHGLERCAMSGAPAVLQAWLEDLDAHVQRAKRAMVLVWGLEEGR